MIHCMACGGEHKTTLETHLCRPNQPPIKPPNLPFDAYTCKPGVSYVLGGQTWVMTERWEPAGRSQDGHNLLFRNKEARQIARWVHPDELQHLHRLGVVTVPEAVTNG